MDNYKEFLEKAKNLNAKIKLTVKADANDADYVYTHNTYSVEEFEKYNIVDDYDKLKTLEGRDYIWYIIARKAYNDWDSSDEHFHGNILLTPQDEEFIKDFDKYCDYIPYNVNCDWLPVHTIESVLLELVIPC